MEAQTPTSSLVVEEPEHTQENRQDFCVESSMSGTKPLLQAWEKVYHGDTPRSALVSASFYLPFLPEFPGNNTPHVALWRRGGLPNGILIGRLDIRHTFVGIGILRFPIPKLRILHIVQGGLEALDSATAHQQARYLRQLLDGGSIDCISIQRLPLDTAIGQILARGLRSPGDGNPIVAAHWFTELTDSKGDPVVTNSAKTRSAFRRMDRKLCKFFDNQVQLREFRNREQVPDFIKMAAHIGERSYQKGIGVGVQDNSWWSTLLKIHADNGNLRAYILEAKGKPIAYAVGSLWRSTYSGLATSYLPEYRPVSPGAYLLRRMIEQFQSEGVRWFDYGGGDASYKEIYGTWRREDATLKLYATSPTATVARILDSTATKARSGLYHALESWGLIKYLKHLRRRNAEPSRKTRPD